MQFLVFGADSFGASYERVRDPWRSFTDEGEKIGVDPVRLGHTYAVVATLVDLQDCAWDELRTHQGGRCNRDDLVIITVKEEGRDIKLLEIIGEVGLGEGLDTVVEVLMPPRIP